MQHEQTWDALADVVSRCGYTDGSRFWLERDDESNYAKLCITVHAPNSYHGTPGNRQDRYTRHEFIVPVATYDTENWRRWVYECLKTIAVHEVGEWFRFDDIRVFPPHHGNGESPYVEWTTCSHPEAQAAAAPGEDYRDYL